MTDKHKSGRALTRRVRQALMQSRAHALMGLCAILLSGCTDWAGYDLDKAYDAVPIFSKMRRSIVPDPYDMVRLPAPHSIPSINPSGNVPAPFNQTQLDSAAATFHYAAAVTPALVERGKLKFEQNCVACHGPAGKGDGPVVGNGKFPFAPPLVSGAALTRPDGYLYGVIVSGRNFMPPYGERLREEDRWAVVSYVRHLQGRQMTTVPTPTTTIATSPTSAAAVNAGAALPVPSNVNVAPTTQPPAGNDIVPARP